MPSCFLLSLQGKLQLATSHVLVFPISSKIVHKSKFERGMDEIHHSRVQWRTQKLLKVWANQL